MSLQASLLYRSNDLERRPKSIYVTASETGHVAGLVKSSLPNPEKEARQSMRKTIQCQPAEKGFFHVPVHWPTDSLRDCISQILSDP